MNLEPLSRENLGPLRWDRGPLHTRSHDFPPSYLCSDEGAHLVKTPCTAQWWKSREAQGNFSLGYMLRTAEEEYIIEGWTSEEMARHFESGPTHELITISKKENGETVASFDGLKSISFSDGAFFTLKLRHRSPILVDQRYEFVDRNGVNQYSGLRVNKLMLNEGTDRTHILLLMAAERFIREVLWYEAPG